MEQAADYMVFEQLGFTYPDTSAPALHCLSVTIPKGCRTAVIGHNGSGKSTLFLHALGILRPQSGRVSWKGKPLEYGKKELVSLRRNVGLVFQDPEQQLIMSTPLDDVSFGLRSLGLEQAVIQQRSQEALERLGLGGFGDKPIHQLSLGQKKRTALAGVMAMEPELILLDEPTAYLDPLSEALLLEGLEAIHGKGTTVVMATHDMDLAYRWADWLIVLSGGQCYASGTPEQVFSDPEVMQSIGLGLPILADLWHSLPQKAIAGMAAPRNVGEMKELLQQFVK
ncbi:energy-coupling factor ABC transporter ATP-binding protein [Paenibacillus donghaensis]|uniref:ABC transporter ATP-binding protein n=1 Tax=Paenibacillus donghaensis TaxID=414771 RepID=A0A2Z2KMV0_9BACL|nr:ABC transporter ATP-binding protein [Paenibacillus donghaensis]ASA20038.1 cobalt ABC transporter ATP-binding protein [Paenibacillus donghaensis]